jgi:uncharacterized OsmC-like protein
MDLRSIQAPLKERYKSEPDAAMITLMAKADETSGPMACSVDLGRTIYAAEAHAGVGGAGTAACSGDLLLAALAACAQITCQMVANASGLPVERVNVTVEGDLDLRGTLGVSRHAPVGFQSIRVKYDVQGPDLTEKQMSDLKKRAEAFCVVMQTLVAPPKIETVWGEH